MLRQDAVDVGNARGASLSRRIERVQWYVNRLRCMSATEIAHRARRTLMLQSERWGINRAAPAPPSEFTRPCTAWVRIPSDWDPRSCIEAAERIAAGRYTIFALHEAELGNPPQWNRDPKTGVDAPMLFGKLLDYRDAARVGDIKYLWELNRHLHLVTLAQAHAVHGEARHGIVLRQHILSWIEACPYGLGPNWSSALEVAIRLINWSAAWQILGGPQSTLFREHAGTAFRGRWLQSIYEHAHYIRGHYSLYSSANNHLIGEAAALYIAGLTWPGWPCSKAWRDEARAILEREILLQNAPDGVNLEQAVAYQRFDLELFLLCWLAGAANGEPFSPAFRSRLESMLEYLASVMDVSGGVPMIGDSDDAVVVRFDPEEAFCGYRSLLATGALIFGRGDFAKKAAMLDARSRWLIRDAAKAFQRLDESRATLPVRQAFPHGGYYILGCNFETADEIRLVVDAGPLGYQGIAAHGHADALALWLSVAGTEFLVDPGTYAYHTNEEWRSYFRSTAAHNTVRVDGQDQSRSGGKFMWVRKARASCTHWSSTDTLDVFEGRHDGYLHLPDPVLHERRIILDKPARRILIEDRLHMKSAHAIELFFHCSEHCRVKRAAAGYTVHQGAHAISVMLPEYPVAQHEVRVGQVAPMLGWISRRLDEKRPAPTLVWRARISGDAILRTVIGC